MYNIIFEWKPFRAHLPSLHALLQQNADVTKYCGMSASYKLTIHFQEDITDELILQDISSMWDSLTEEGEAAKFQLDTDREAAVVAAKSALLTASFDSLIPAERKLWMGVPTTSGSISSTESTAPGSCRQPPINRVSPNGCGIPTATTTKKPRN